MKIPLKARCFRCKALLPTADLKPTWKGYPHLVCRAPSICRWRRERAFASRQLELF
jgi:hypothetical protein